MGMLTSFTINGETVDDKYMQFEADYKDVTETVLNQIEQLNSGTELSNVLDTTTIINTANADLPHLLLLTRVQNLVVRMKSDDSLVSGVTNVRATWEVPNLTEDLGRIYVLHYSVNRNVWEIINPIDINYIDKTITADFIDLSPAAVAYVPVKNVETTDAKSTKTGDETHIELYVILAVAAIVLLVIIIIKTRKKK